MSGTFLGARASAGADGDFQFRAGRHLIWPSLFAARFGLSMPTASRPLASVSIKVPDTFFSGAGWWSAAVRRAGLGDRSVGCAHKARRRPYWGRTRPMGHVHMDALAMANRPKNSARVANPSAEGVYVACPAGGGPLWHPCGRNCAHKLNPFAESARAKSYAAMGPSGANLTNSSLFCPRPPEYPAPAPPGRDASGRQGLDFAGPVRFGPRVIAPYAAGSSVAGCIARGAGCDCRPRSSSAGIRPTDHAAGKVGRPNHRR